MIKAGNLFYVFLLILCIFFWKFIRTDDQSARDLNIIKIVKRDSLITHDDIYKELMKNVIIPETQLIKPNYFQNTFVTNINISQNPFPQNEPSVKIDRKNPNRILAAFRDFRTGVDTARRRVGYSFSSDGGMTWSESKLLPPYDSTMPYASDPAVCVDTSGNFYISTISLNLSRTKLSNVVYKSTNNGLSFDHKVDIAPSAETTSFADKDYITCDLVNGSPFKNNLYVVWFADSTGNSLSRSTDGGISWSNRIRIEGNDGAGLVPAVGFNGELYITSAGGSASGINFTRSTDGGLSFLPNIIIDTIPSGGFIFRLPSIAVDNSGTGRNGYIYIVWSNNIYAEEDEDIFLKYSSDRGASWSQRIRVNDDPIGDGKKQYWPWICVNKYGHVFIVYYKALNLGYPTSIQAYIAKSFDGCQSFSTGLLSSEISPIDLPNPDVRFGDYIGIDAWDDHIVPVWTDQRAGGYNMEIYTANIIDSVIGIQPISGNFPGTFKLEQNFPNPFNPNTKIQFALPKSAFVKVVVYDVLGKEIETLVNEQLNAGTYQVDWNADKFSSGIYYYKISTGNYSETKKMVLIK